MREIGKLTFVIDADEVEPRVLLKKFGAFCSFWELALKSMPQGKKIDIKAKVEKGSCRLVLDLNGEAPISEYLQSNYEKIQKIQKGERVVDLPKKCYNHLKNFTSNNYKTQYSYNDVGFFDLTEDIAKEIDEIIKPNEKAKNGQMVEPIVIDLQSRSHTSRGTLRGKLVAVSSSNGNCFVIKDEAFNREVKCNISQAILEEFLLKAKDFYNHRVSLAGKIEYIGAKPKKIHLSQMKDIRLLDAKELPSIEEMFGILKR